MAAAEAGCHFLVNICQIKCCIFFSCFLWPSLWSNPQILELMHLLAGMPLGKSIASDYLQEANVSICKCENFHRKARSVSVFHPVGDQWQSHLTLVSRPNWATKIRAHFKGIPAWNESSWENDNWVFVSHERRRRKTHGKNYCLCFTLRPGYGHLAFADYSYFTLVCPHISSGCKRAMSQDGELGSGSS